jgi:hypothetical protein
MRTMTKHAAMKTNGIEERFMMLLSTKKKKEQLKWD